ncbi:MAG: methyltransferase, partial [Pseudomonadota bacterium]|nr:methyltransferase [Pseudomonadota bacterium]
MAEANLGPLALKRWPHRRGDPLLPFDAADRYLLKQLDEHRRGPATLVLNDQCGALWLTAAASGPAWSAGDDWLCWRAAVANAEDNGRAAPGDAWLWPWQAPPRAPDQVLLRLPKAVSLLEAQLAWLADGLPAGPPVWLAGMDKHLPAQLVPLLEHWLGNGRAGLGWKKARLFTAEAPGAALREAPEPARVAVPERGWTLQAGPGVFGRRHLDIGARFLLDHLPTDVSGEVADLGCGNGVLGLSLAADNPSARVTFCDVSFLAVESARTNVVDHDRQPERHHFHLGNGLEGIDKQFDLILLNPPWHRRPPGGARVGPRRVRPAAPPRPPP